MSITEYIKHLQSFEEYAFSWEEVLENCKSPVSTLRKELNRLAKKNEITNLRKGFYLILPPRYQQMGKLPIQLYIEKLLKYLERDYYLGLYSAAAIHGASHQRIQQEYIITKPQVLRDIEKGNNRIRFFISENWSTNNIVEKKSDAGKFKVSSPALTAVDLIYYQTKIGGANRILANLEELFEKITNDDLTKLLAWYPYKSALQRLGFFMEETNASEELIELIYQHLQKDSFYPALLSPTQGQRPGKTGNRWKIDVNIKLESDL